MRRDSHVISALGFPECWTPSSLFPRLSEPTVSIPGRCVMDLLRKQVIARLFRNPHFPLSCPQPCRLLNSAAPQHPFPPPKRRTCPSGPRAHLPRHRHAARTARPRLRRPCLSVRGGRRFRARFCGCLLRRCGPWLG